MVNEIINPSYPRRIIRGISLNIRFSDNTDSYCVKVDNINRSGSVITSNLKYMDACNNIINLYNAHIIRVDYTLSSPYKLSSQHYANNQYNDINIRGMLLATQKNGYIYSNKNEIFNNKLSPITVLPEIEYYACFDDKHITHAIVGDKFIDTGFLDPMDDLFLTSDEYTVHAFGYTIDHSLKICVNSIALKDENDIISTYKFKDNLIEGHPRDFATS